MSDSREAILAARGAINEAIDRRDADGIARFLLPTYHVVTARNGQRNSRDESAKSWKQMFEHDKTARYSRITEEICINEGWGSAHEQGRWTGTVSAKQGLLQLSGVYAAKWQFTEEGWMLQAEIFTALNVEGPD